jgi:hypothetical protein
MLSAERAEGAPEAIYGAECLICEAQSGLADNDPKPVEVWALEHARHKGLSHGQFLVTTQKHWRVDSLRGVPRAAPAPSGDAGAPAPAVAVAAPPQPRRSGTHARPRGRWLARHTVLGSLRTLAACARRAAGPLFLSTLLRGSVLVGILPRPWRGQATREHARLAENPN